MMAIMPIASGAIELGSGTAGTGVANALVAVSRSELIAVILRVALLKVMTNLLAAMNDEAASFTVTRLIG